MLSLLKEQPCLMSTCFVYVKLTVQVNKPLFDLRSNYVFFKSTRIWLMLNLRSYLLSNYVISANYTVPFNEHLFNLCCTYRSTLISSQLIYSKYHTIYYFLSIILFDLPELIYIKHILFNEYLFHLFPTYVVVQAPIWFMLNLPLWFMLKLLSNLIYLTHIVLFNPQLFDLF